MTEKNEETEKVQQLDEENIDHFSRSMFNWAKKLVVFRNGYNYFLKNKVWILSLLFVLSIIRASIWYALWGINILSYSNLQDIFFLFADYFMSIIVIGMWLACFYLFYPQQRSNSRVGKVVRIIFLIIFALLLLWFILSLYRMILPVIFLLSIAFTLYAYFVSKKKIAVLWYSSLLLSGITLFQPMEQYFHASTSVNEEGGSPVAFIERSAHYDFISFDYNDIHIDTRANKHYFIGSNSNYFFIFDREARETLIIPKVNVTNIRSRPFGLRNLLFFR